MNVEFVASFSPITADPQASQAFYREALGLPFEGGDSPEGLLVAVCYTPWLHGSAAADTDTTS
jgi:catechol 2,3-dioxygenase-like lactoylglutathione lyase family enzyme